MKKLTIVICFVVVLFSGVSIVMLVPDSYSVIGFFDKKEKEQLKERIRELEVAEQARLREIEEDEKLGQYTINMMHRVGAAAKLSNAMMQVLASTIVRVCNQMFDDVKHKHGFIGALAIESSFAKYAQSPTGPKGLAQLARGTFHESMERCGVGKAKDDDVWETEINLIAGACYYRYILGLKMIDGDIVAAAVAYNQGQNSASIKSYANTGRLENIEALKYIARVTFLKRVNSDSKLPNVPSMEELKKQ